MSSKLVVQIKVIINSFPIYILYFLIYVVGAEYYSDLMRIDNR